MNQKLKKQIIKNFVVFFSTVTIFAVANPQPSYAMMGHNQINQNEPNQDELNRRLWNAKNEFGDRIILRRATENGHTNIVNFLLNKCANVNDKDDDGRTALMIAAKYGYTDIVNALLAHGADVNIKDNLGMTALMYAAENDNIDIVNALLEHGADVNAKDKHKKTSLDMAQNNKIKQILIGYRAKHGYDL